MSDRPSGIITFLFTDIEGSTKLAQEHPDKWEDLRARHHTILQDAMDAHNGYVFQIIGDAFCVAFPEAIDGLNSAIDAQHKLQNEDWGEAPIKARMGIHTGMAEIQTDGEYRGYLTMSLVQRVMSAGHGGQILLTQASETVLWKNLPNDVSLRDMGRHKFKDFVQPVGVFQVVAPGLQSEFPALRAPDVFLNNLPTQLTSFIGREKEIAELERELKNNRLITLTGSGGTGKTRLSLQVAHQIMRSFSDGVWFIELAPISNPLLVPNTVANVLHVMEEAGRPLTESLTDWLKDKETLLILDNCEHLIDACAQFADLVLHACPKASLLATSRESLGIAGESSYRVPSLPLPDVHEEIEENASVKLFIERARQAKADFKITRADKVIIEQICQRLDGIPLAIELAAARVKVLSVQQIDDRLFDRFRLLTGGSRTALPRQQTLRALIDWSYNLLSDDEKKLLRGLAVFVGGWTLDAAESVCGEGRSGTFDVLDVLTHLVDKSLVNVETDGGDVRYGWLETIRQYAREKLFETDENARSRASHLDYFVQFAEGAEIKLRGREQKRWLARLESEHDNLRAALEWSLKSKPDLGLRLAASLRDFWDTHGHITEARQWLETMLDATQNLPPTPARVDAFIGASWMAARQSEVERMKILLDEGTMLAKSLGYKRGVALGLSSRGVIKENFDNDIAQAELLYRQALELWREIGDKLAIGQALDPLASCALRKHEYARAENLYRESLALFREMENEREIAGALENLAEVALERRNYSSAHDFAEESLVLYRELEDKHGVATALRALSSALQNEGNMEQARNAGEQSEVVFRELHDRGCMAWTLAILARAAHVQGDLEYAENIAAEAAALLHEIGDKVTETRALEALGRIALARRESSKAIRYFQDGLALLKEVNDTGQIPSLLEGVGLALTASSQSRTAILIMGAAEALREKIGLAIMQIERPDYDRTTSLLHDLVDGASFQKIWDEGRVITMEEAIELALEKFDE